MFFIGLVLGMLIGILFGAIAGYRWAKNKLGALLEKKQAMSDKHLAIAQLLSMWIQNKEHGLKISDYLLRHNIKRIAIYGMSFVGERLYDELEDSEIQVIYCIDKNANNIYKDVDVLTPDEELEGDIDAVIVTAFTFFEEIQANLKNKVDTQIISIDDIVYSL